MNLSKFIKTKDLNTKVLLEKKGFVFICENNGVWTFLNQCNKPDEQRVTTLLFDQSKCVFANTLTF